MHHALSDQHLSQLTGVACWLHLAVVVAFAPASEVAAACACQWMHLYEQVVVAFANCLGYAVLLLHHLTCCPADCSSVAASAA